MNKLHLNLEKTKLSYIEIYSFSGKDFGEQHRKIQELNIQKNKINI